MNRRAIYSLLANGDTLPSADITALKLPAVATAAASYVVAKYIPGPVQRVILTLSSLPVTVANTSGASFGSVQLLDFPQGRIRIEGGTVDLSVDWSASADLAATHQIVLTGSGDAAIGTTATADATLSSTDVDLMASTAMTDPVVAGVGDLHGVFVKDTEFDGTATAKDAYLNVIIDDADVEDTGTSPIYVTGTIILDVAYSGDY